MSARGVHLSMDMSTNHNQRPLVAAKRGGRSTSSAASGSKTASKRKAAKSRVAREKDPRGGLTAAGRAAFHRKDGSNLKPGVKKKPADMSPADMKRKGSWAVRFYGRKGKLPPLKDEHGQPTRYALTAAAWGEPVPKTIAAARAIAAKGRRLLERAKKLSA